MLGLVTSATSAHFLRGPLNMGYCWEVASREYSGALNGAFPNEKKENKQTSKKKPQKTKGKGFEVHIRHK